MKTLIRTFKDKKTGFYGWRVMIYSDKDPKTKGMETIVLGHSERTDCYSIEEAKGKAESWITRNKSVISPKRSKLKRKKV